MLGASNINIDIVDLNVASELESYNLGNDLIRDC